MPVLLGQTWHKLPKHPKRVLGSLNSKEANPAKRCLCDNFVSQTSMIISTLSDPQRGEAAAHEEEKQTVILK
jgi:acetaldehyde dehydrogenase (acetylating)